MKFLLFFFLLTGPVQSDSPVSTYALKNLRSTGIGQISLSSGSRHYLSFQNEQGKHVLVYDESPGVNSIKEIDTLRLAMGRGGVCAVELSCRAKAFCTDDCRTMYYELTNAPLDPAMSARDKCKIKSFECALGGGPAGNPNGI